MSKLYDVLSPDGYPIRFEPFDSKKDALEYIPQWVKRYEIQGHYTTGKWERIPLEELPSRLSLVQIQAD